MIKITILLAFTAAAAAADFNAGPMAARLTGRNGDTSFTAAGPFFERGERDDGSTFLAVRPFFSAAQDPVTNRKSLETLYPLARWRSFDKYSSWRVLTVFGQGYDIDKKSRYRVLGLPFVFFGRDSNGEAYACLFPLWGSIHELLGRDVIRVRMFPLYMYHSVKGIETRSYLFPFMSFTNSEHINRFRFFPFYSRSENRKLGTVNKFILWPFWTSVKSTKPGSKDGGFLLFPFFGAAHNAEKEALMLFPPLFRHERDGPDLSVNCPWPFVRYKSGRESMFYIWPLWGKRKRDNIESSFLLFPVIGKETIRRKYEQVERSRIFPFLSIMKTSPTLDCLSLPDSRKKEFVSRFVFRVWPVFSYSRAGGSAGLRVLDLWPASTPEVVKRNLAPLWTLYSRVSSKGGMEDCFLWGLMRRSGDADRSSFSFFPFFDSDSQGPEYREWSILKGLISRKRDGLRRSYRLLYFINIGGERREGSVDAD